MASQKFYINVTAIVVTPTGPIVGLRQFAFAVTVVPSLQYLNDDNRVRFYGCIV